MTALWISHRTGDLFTLIEWASLSSSSSRSLFAVSGLAGCTWRERLHPPVGLGAAKAGLSDVTSRFSSIKSCCCWACTTTRWQTSGPAVSQESDRSNKEDTDVQFYRALFFLRLEWLRQHASKKLSRWHQVCLMQYPGVQLTDHRDRLISSPKNIVIEIHISAIHNLIRSFVKQLQFII